MKTYADLIRQTFDFPTSEFKIENNTLHFHHVDLMALIREYGTPLRVYYLPKIQQNIAYAQQLFNAKIKKLHYEGQYTYCYCTKSSHFKFILDEVLKKNVHLETSSAYDIPIVRHLENDGKLSKQHYILCNGFKDTQYIQNIADCINDGFSNCIPILDNVQELAPLENKVHHPFQIGLRLAADEEPNFSFYTSRLGIRYEDAVALFKNKIKNNPKFQLKILHYFIHTGIKDSAYFWTELSRFVETYCKIKAICPELDTLDIGGGFPIKNSLAFHFNYGYMVENILSNIQKICKKNRVPTPNIFTEFGNFTVGECGTTLYAVLGEKQQNDKELWYMMNGSFITHMPDIWALNEKFILLPVNLWNNPYQKVNIGGLTCDSMDYYDSEAHISEVFLPVSRANEPLFFGFFHNGAYQESLGGYGGIQHCLIPAPKHVIIQQNESGVIEKSVFSEQQTSADMMQILGYKSH